MGGYSNPRSLKYAHFFDWGGAADETLSYIGPKTGRRGLLWDYGAEGITEVFAGSTVTPKIAIGDGSDPDAYGEEFVLHGIAADAVTAGIRQLYDENDTAFETTYLVDRELPADTLFQIALTGATGSPTGQATAYCIVDWAD